MKIEIEESYLIDLRTKVEFRGWVARISIALNVALVGAFCGFVLNRVF